MPQQATQSTYCNNFLLRWETSRRLRLHSNNLLSTLKKHICFSALYRYLLDGLVGGEILLEGFGSLAGSTVVCIENNASDQLLRLSNLDAHHEFSLRNGKYRIPIKVHYSGHHSKQAISPLKPFRLPPSNSKHLCHRGQPLALSFDIQAEQLYQFPAGKYQGNFVLMVYTE